MAESELSELEIPKMCWKQCLTWQVIYVYDSTLRIMMFAVGFGDKLVCLSFAAPNPFTGIDIQVRSVVLIYEVIRRSRRSH